MKWSQAVEFVIHKSVSNMRLDCSLIDLPNNILRKMYVIDFGTSTFLEVNKNWAYELQLQCCVDSILSCVKVCFDVLRIDSAQKIT